MFPASKRAAGTKTGRAADGGYWDAPNRRSNDRPLFCSRLRRAVLRVVEQRCVKNSGWWRLVMPLSMSKLIHFPEERRRYSSNLRRKSCNAGSFAPAVSEITARFCGLR